MSEPRYRILTGEFHVFCPDQPMGGPEPDGDTVTFRPDQLDLVWRLRRYGRRTVRLNPSQMIEVRFEGIDALETHFEGTHQELVGAHAARDFVLQRLGFKGVTFWDDVSNRVRSVETNMPRGYLAAGGIDGNGRVLAFVYRGTPRQRDGERVFLTPTLVDQSVNAAVLTAGLAYADLYTSLPIALAKHLREVARQTRRRGSGFWAREHLNTQHPCAVPNVAILERLVVWPKLFRRLAAFFAEGYSELAAFDRWLRQDPEERDDYVLLPTGELGNIHDLVEVQEQLLRLTHEPEDIIILPDEFARIARGTA